MSPPDLPAELILQVPASPPSAVVRRLGQGRPPAVAPQAVLASVPWQGRPLSPPGSPAKLVLRVSGVCRPPSPSGSSAVPARVARQALFASAKAPSPPGSSAVPARVARQALFASANKRRPRQGRPPSSPGSPAKLFTSVWSLSSVRVVECRCFSQSPAKLVLRVSGVCRPPSRQGRPPSSLCECQKATSLPGSPAKLFQRVSPRQGRPPSPFYECASAVPVSRRPRQGRPPSSFYKRVSGVCRPPSPPRSPAKLFLRVPKRRPRQGRPPSSPGSPAKLVLRVSGVCRPPSPSGSPAKLSLRVPNPSGSSAVPARVAHQALFASAKAPFRQGGPPSPSGSCAVPARVARQVERRPRQAASFYECLECVVRRPRQGRLRSPAKLFLRVPKRRPRVVRRPRQGRFCEWQSAVPARVVRRPRQGRPPSSFYECLESVFHHPRVARQALFASAKAPSPPGSSGVARQALFASAKAPSPPASSAVPVRQGRPPSSFCECQSTVPARPPSSFYECLESVVRRPRQGRPPPRQSRPPSSIFLRVPKRRPRQGRPPSRTSECVPARVVRRPRQGRPPSFLKDVPAPPGFSRWEIIKGTQFTIVPHG